MSELVWLLVILAVSAALVAAGAALVGRVRPGAAAAGGVGPDAPPLAAEIEQALLPFAFAGVCAAYRVSEWAIDRVGRRLRGADKRAVALAAYRLLPERVGRFDLGVVKQLVPPERFAQLVQDAFDRFDAQFAAGQARYQELFRDFTRSRPAPRRPAPPPDPAAAPDRHPAGAPPPEPAAATAPDHRADPGAAARRPVDTPPPDPAATTDCRPADASAPDRTAATVPDRRADPGAAARRPIDAPPPEPAAITADRRAEAARPAAPPPDRADQAGRHRPDPPARDRAPAPGATPARTAAQTGGDDDELAG